MGKTILVTGANRGIGLEISKQLLALGHTVILAGRDADALNAAKRSLDQSVDAHILQMDVCDDESVFDAYNKVKSKHKKLDVLINNAGILPDQHDTTDVTVKAMKKTMETNMYGPLRTSQTFLDLLYKSDESRIINVSSGMGAFSEMMGSYAVYRISKTALNSLTAVMSFDLNNAIKVVAVSPGWVQTDMGGASAPRTVEEGASGIVDLATRKFLESGKFYRDGEQISW